MPTQVDVRAIKRRYTCFKLDVNVFDVLGFKDSIDTVEAQEFESLASTK